MKKVIKKIAFVILFHAFILNISSQTEGVSIKNSPSAPHPSAMLDIESTTKGILVPRVSLTSLTSSSPIASTPTIGLLVFNTNSSLPTGEGFYYWNSSPSPGKWIKISNGSDNFWTQDMAVSSPSMAIYRETAGPSTVSIGQRTTATQHTTLQVNCPAIFYSGANNPGMVASSFGNTYGLHIGEERIGNELWWNNITTYGEELRLNCHGGENVDLGTVHGSNLGVSWGYVANNGTGLASGRGEVRSLSHIRSYWGFIYSQGNQCISDSTQKKNISEVTSVLDQIGTMKTYKYNFKTESNEAAKHYGVMSQEVASIFPDLVRQVTDTIPDNTTGEPTTVTRKFMDYNGLTAILLKAIREQQAIIENLESRVNDLEHH